MLIKYSGDASERGSAATRVMLIVAIASCAILLIWSANQAWFADQISTSTPPSLQPIDVVVLAGADSDLSIPVPPQSDPLELTPPSTVPTGESGNGLSASTLAQVLSVHTGDNASPPSEQALRQIQDETIENLIATDFAARYEQFNRLVELQPQMDDGVITGLLVIPRGPRGAELLLQGGLLQNDIIISVNDKTFVSMAIADSLPGSFIVELLTAPSTRLGVLRGGSEIQVIFELDTPDNAPQ